MILLVLFLVFGSVATLAYCVVPIITRRASDINKQQVQRMSNNPELYLQDDEVQKAQKMIIIMPIILAVCGFMFFPEIVRLPGIAVGIIVGVILPKMYISSMIAKRKAKFADQLIDSLMIMSSSFRGGLSLVQAIEAVVEEMPDPCKREFGIVLGENKMGVLLEESLNRLYKRMPSVALQQMITAILLARETGGNLPVIFSRIVGTIRERKKIEQNLKTLTIQGKIQAVVMTGLPIFFVVGVSGSNPKFFEVMFKLPEGRTMLIVCAVLWVVGAFFIWKISKFKDV